MLETFGLHVGEPNWSRPAQGVLSKAGTLTCGGMSIFGNCSDIGGIASVTIGTADGDSLQKNKKLSLHVKGNTVIKGDTQTPYALRVSGGEDYKLYVEGNAKFEHPNIGDLNDRFNTADDRGKTFDIINPTKKEGHRLRYACIEGPEVGVYYRGRLKNDTEIVLPYYWKDLVHTDSITVQLQPIGAHQDIIVKRWDAEKIYLQAKPGFPINCFYHVYAERKDINPLIVEYAGDTSLDYPDPNFTTIQESERVFNDPQYAGSRNTITI